MSFIKILKAPSKLFKKDVITFLTIRRHDLGVLDNKLHYIAVKPTASISVLRQKVWHLLDLPDYCDEIIKLESEDGKELPLTDLRTGNEPQHPYILEVWLPGNQSYTSGYHKNMLTMGDSSILNRNSSSGTEFEEKIHNDSSAKSTGTPIFKTTVAINTKNENKANTLPSDCKSEVCSKISSTSLFFKLHGRKSRDNFTNILLKIQNDLIVLSNKLSNLENKIQI
ncbi:unnamed protein product [Pieris macdunnoughi]|uniref:Uncharacterized protein n=1 Tax=Pieris macdunnoughi TaxID=345717 RepID=A0A821PDT8_9NEOP|nr:unnamed protein product [Pieris macdunnoughi]